MDNTSSLSETEIGNVEPNLNVSKSFPSVPVEYSLLDEKTRDPITAWTVLAVVVLILILGTTLGATIYVAKNPGLDIQHSIRAVLPGAAPDKPDSQATRNVQSTLEANYATMDATFARKAFPWWMYAPHYTEVSARGSTEDYGRVRDRVNSYLAHSVSFKEETQVAQVTLTASDTALVAINQIQTNTAPLAFFAESTPRPSDATAHLVETVSSRAVDTWKRNADGTWQLQKDTVLAQSPPRRRVEIDNDIWGNASDAAERPEDLPEKNQIDALYHSLDEQRARGQFPVEGYVSDWKTTDTQGGVHTLEEEKRSLASLTSACDTPVFATQLDDFMLTSPAHAFAKVTRRFLLKGTGRAKSEETASRREADTWRLTNGVWQIESTQQLSNSALWNYRERFGLHGVSSSNNTSATPGSIPNPLSDDEIRSLMTTRRVTVADLRGRSREEIAFIRNEPFARRGYIFRTPYIKDHFATKSWYQPSSSMVPQLSGIEAKNVEFVKKYQDTQSNRRVPTVGYHDDG